MAEQTAPTDTVPTGPRSRFSSFAFLGSCCAALVVLALIIQFARGAWGAADFPRVAPEDMADRVFQRSQEAYGVLGFTRTVEPGVEVLGVSTENTLGSGSGCYGGGLFDLEETVDGAYRMSHSWALDHVPASQAVPGLRRLHQHLKDDGWEITSYRGADATDDWDLFVERNDGDERMSFTWLPDREYFMGGATGPCAYDPEWEDGDTGPAGGGLRPPAFGPARQD
ncbi:hypothetical protein [Streptomyces sp. NRRL WC-3549]|uniref:hypothetical protein n=1 Tax=Streptomyces sp. NRRL WC-3549 TaxID=1463925 RepID=UPI0004C6AB0C|nr:hypothetical protein [Streptomyces sp. NRRL WC-3549]